MKKLLITLPIIFALASCGSNENHDSHNHDAHNHDTHTGHDHATEEAVISYKTHDPLCKMVRDTIWTEMSIVNNDTIMFCSAMCKKTFDANPEKYMK